MPRNTEPLTKHTLNLFEGDYDTLRTYYPDVGAGVIIRHLVRKYIKRIQDGSEKPSDIDFRVEL